MKKSRLAGVIFFLVLLGVSSLEAQQVGLGVIFGEPSTGLSLKFWPGHGTSLDAALSWTTSGGETYFRIHGDVLFNRYLRMNPGAGRVAFYYGLGLRFLQRDDRVGLRFPLGLSYYFGSIPLELFVEFVPTLDLSPSTEFFPKVAAGLRIYL